MRIHPTAIVENGATLGDISVGAYCQIGANVNIADGSQLESHVVISGNTVIGPRAHVHSFSVLGGPPQHLGYRKEATSLKIGADTIIREHVTMNCGTPEGGGETLIGEGGYFMTGAHVAHDCKVGNNVIFANNATLGGHVSVGDYAFLGGLSAIHQHCRIGKHAFIGGCAAVTLDIIPFGSAVGNHARLAGLNVIGLKRHGFSREAIKSIRSAYKYLFEGEGTFKDRVAQAYNDYAHCTEVLNMLQFISDASNRPLMTPQRES